MNGVELMDLNQLYENIVKRTAKLAVVGLGYVGLPLAVAFARKADVIGFDVSPRKIADYLAGKDPTGDVGDAAIKASSIDFTSDEARLGEASFYILAVPTPVQNDKVPDLTYVKNASAMVGKHLRPGSVVVYESTVYPGVTEEVCVPILEAESGLTCGVDFKVGYSPERINPGDQVHRLENIVKIVSGMDEQTLGLVAQVYELVIEAGVYRAESIRVAEAAKVIENAQRDINIAFMNELSMLFHRMGIDTKAVLAAAGTKWNFLKFTPGLVGGHCIGIDPYYLTYKAEDAGYHSKIISAGRRINDGMGKYVARSIVKLLMRLRKDLSDVKVGILGLAYKEDCPDFRNTKVTDIIAELKEYDIQPLVCDPLVDPRLVYEEHGLELAQLPDLRDLNVVVLAVPHREFLNMAREDYDRLFGADKSKVFFDIKAVFDKSEFEASGYHYWSL
ncbi:nucleotide sugar dehydrogenase [Paenibacillus macerans]|uniref:Nucleotide sugar dehydrogenase family protein n=4 Tax=Paenibacillus macerans TaxID=44252 RepID=A0A090Z5D9_PAEMA|nr:nucleotide sugar dehydrogenase family protein [Paenibacillus macerans]SUA85681.1 nucleotide sugar dehydrogenase [Paenibacillus macerans]